MHLVWSKIIVLLIEQYLKVLWSGEEAPTIPIQGKRSYFVKLLSFPAPLYMGLFPDPTRR